LINFVVCFRAVSVSKNGVASVHMNWKGRGKECTYFGNLVAVSEIKNMKKFGDPTEI
jgi:hypothetical protein